MKRKDERKFRSISEGSDVAAIQEALITLGEEGICLPQGPIRTDVYGDTPSLSRNLIGLILSGRKRAGSALLWSYEFDGEQVPKAGDIEIVLDHLRRPVLVARILRADIVAFDLVTAEYAAKEGEGDASLAYWRRSHWAFFRRECIRIGRVPGNAMPVVCSTFELLHIFGSKAPRIP